MEENEPHTESVFPEFLPWLDPETQSALNLAGSASGMSPTSLAMYARWWQLETWLRELAYLETRALGLQQWAGLVDPSNKRQRDDSALSHMLGPDSESTLAYFDYSRLLKLIQERWDLFENTLISRASWEGRQSDLSPVRNRIAHARRPHRDDLGRIEQTLRDLERGAFIAVATYNDRWRPDDTDSKSAIVSGWIQGEHQTARRLLDHAQRQYETTLQLRQSFRPWGRAPDGATTASPKLWHADFLMGGRSVDVGKLWREIAERELARLAIHVAVDRYSVGFVFSDNDDPEQIADAIGEAFDAVLLSRSLSDDRPSWDAETKLAAEMDFRIKVDTAWNIIDSTTLPVSMFSAGGGVNLRPRWRSGG